MAVGVVGRFFARVRDALGSDAAGIRQALAALLVSSGGDLVAGLTLAGLSDQLTLLPGLLVLIPAAIGMRGNIFGALGSRLGTAIHTGTFRISRRRDTVVGQNVWASLSLTLSVSLALAVLAKVVAETFSGGEVIGLADFVVISMIGGVISSIVVLGLTLGVASLSVRRGWDLDNVAAPIVTAAGDMVTLPSLFLAALIVRLPGVTLVAAVITAALGLLAVVMSARSRLPILRRIARESLPVLIVAGTIDIIAGLALNGQYQAGPFVAFPALLILVPPFLEDTGALGSVLSARLSSKLHLGIIEPASRPQRAARVDFTIILLLALPVFTLVAISSEIAATVFQQATPGIVNMVGVALIGGLIATGVGMLVAYYGTIATYRFGLDPDNYGVPLLTASMDLVGAFSLIAAIALLRIG
ncbi:MAG: magnesium transporter [Actinobacteria bacterium]|nr:magnesium transporter [Actinomycetota bacterium]